MRVQLIHAKEFWYKSNKPATKIREPESSLEDKLHNVLVIFTSIEEGDKDRINQVLEEFRNDIERLVKTLNPNYIVLYPYAHLSNKLAPPSEAIHILKKLEEALRTIHKSVHKAPFGWYKEFYIHCYGHPLSELSRSYGVGISQGEECPNISKFIEEISIKPELKEVYKRWGYLGESPVFNQQIYSFINLIQTLARGNVFLTYVKHCKPESILSIVQNNDKLQLIVNDRNLHYLAGPERTVLEILTQAFEIEVKLSNETIYLDNQSIGKCINNLCSTEPLELLLAKRIYIELNKAQSGGYTPILECWLTPSNVYIASANGDDVENAFINDLVKKLRAINGMKIYIDKRKARLGRKLRDAGRLWSHYTVIVGRRDLSSGTISVRNRRSGEQYSENAESFIEKMKIYWEECPLSNGILVDVNG